MYSPDTTIELVNVPIEGNYKYQLWFDTIEEQDAYFDSLGGIVLSDFTYQRKDNVIRIGTYIEDLYPYNYIRYKNKNYGNKYFYAFVENYEYINDSVTMARIKTDVFQTWMFEMKILPSFIVRKHVTNDTPGANMFPENLEIGEYVINNETTLRQAPYLVIATVANEAGEPWGGTLVCNNYQGANLQWLPISSFAAIGDILDKYLNVGMAEAVVGIGLMPGYGVQGPSTGPNSEPIGAIVRDYSIAKQGALNGYTPRNNKLLTYPYILLEADNNTGTVNQYHEELFSDDNITFGATNDIGLNSTGLLIPFKYRGSAENYEESLSLKPYPLSSFTYQAYQNYIALYGFSQNLSLLANVSSVMGSVTGLAESAAAGTATGQQAFNTVSGALRVSSQLAERTARAREPETIKGNVNAAGAKLSQSMLFFTLYSKSIRAEAAKRIDDYFTMFGYAVNELGEIQPHTRRAYNYIQTIDANITGELPDEDVRTIRAAFDSGITFWHDPEKVGDYSQDNGVI